MSEKPFVEATSDRALRRFREYVTAAIALIVILGTIVMMIIALCYSSTFDQVKDLLLIINPLLGVVIGYYFATKSTEARAESAEATAQSAALNAQQATEARNAAAAEAQVATIETQEATAVLSEFSQAAEKVLSQSPVTRTLGVSEEGEPVEDARLDLQVALARAKRITSH